MTQHQYIVSFEVTVDTDEQDPSVVLERISFDTKSHNYTITDSPLEDIEYLGSREKDSEPFTFDVERIKQIEEEH
jgi:hypothetical protein